ncbi:MAG: hypothetical protein WCL50_13800, partial [Spirochaetota bacterium]
MRIRSLSALSAGLLCLVSPLAALDPPSGGQLIPLLASPVASAIGPSPTWLEAPWADRQNPAASASQQRPVVDAGYAFLSDFGGSQGIGSAVNLGVSLPQPYAVLGAGLTFVSTPPDMTELPLGTLVQFRGSIAKSLFPNL